MGHLLVMDMVEQDGLIDGDPRKNWKEGKEDPLGLNPKSMVGNDGKKKNNDDDNEKDRPLFHIIIQRLLRELAWSLHIIIPYRLAKKASKANKVNSVIYDHKYCILTLISTRGPGQNI